MFLASSRVTLHGQLRDLRGVAYLESFHEKLSHRCTQYQFLRIYQQVYCLRSRYCSKGFFMYQEDFDIAPGQIHHPRSFRRRGPRAHSQLLRQSLIHCNSERESVCLLSTEGEGGTLTKIKMQIHIREIKIRKESTPNIHGQSLYDFRCVGS